MDWGDKQLYHIFVPEITIAVTSLLILGTSFFLSEEKKYLSAYFGLGGLLLAFLLSWQFFNLGATSVQKIFSLDQLGLFFRLPILLSGLLVILISADFFLGSKYQSEYYLLLFFSLLGILFTTVATDLVLLYVALELCSIPTYILAGLERSEARSSEAAIKYFLLGLLGSVTMLYGFSLLYGLSGTTNLLLMKEKMAFDQQPLLFLAMALVVFGLGTKIAAVPFHFRLPDAYEGAPTPVTAYLSVGPKIAGFAIILRVFLTTFLTLKNQWMVVFAILSIASMTIGNLLALMQKNVKRMLAYSSIVHTGYLLIGLAVGDRPALSGMLFYLLVYIFANVGVFAIVIANSREGELVENFAGLSQRSPFYAVAMTLFLLSLAGVPPLAGFMGKFHLFSAAVRSGFAWLAVVGVLNSVFSLSYYFSLVQQIYLVKTEKTNLATEINPAKEKPFAFSLLTIAVILVLLAVIFIGLYPSPFINLAQKAITF